MGRPLGRRRGGWLTGSERASKLRAMAYDNFLIDKRIVERNIAKGLVDAEAYKKQVEALPDREQNLVHVSVDGETSDGADLDDDDDLEDDEDDEEADEG
jgi:hypothetical protein